jgi:Uma2 family endonuclease
MSTTKLMTAEDLEQLPEDDFRYELVRGELIRMSPVKRPHGRIAHLVSYYLNEFVLPQGLGEVGGEEGFITEHDPETVRAPDVHFVRADRLAEGEAALHFVETAPDLAVEVRSPSESLASLFSKADEYLAAGARLVWIFDPAAKTVYVRTSDGKSQTLTADDELDGGDVLPGFRLPLRKIFGEG